MAENSEQPMENNTPSNSTVKVEFQVWVRDEYCTTEND
jgi:hypothetical protein